MMKALLHDLRSGAVAWVDRVVRASVRGEMGVLLEVARAELAARDRRLPAGVFLVPPVDAEEVPPTTTGKTVLVDPKGGSTQVELEVYRPVPRGSVLFAWGPVHLDQVLVGMDVVCSGGGVFAVLPLLQPGYRIRVQLSVWERG